MASFWHPLSTLLLIDPQCFCTARLLKMFLAAGEIELQYAGDRMWPTLRHGERVVVRPPDESGIHTGSLVVATPDGIPDLLRVVSVDGDSIDLIADADPEPPIRVPRTTILAQCGPSAIARTSRQRVPTSRLRARRRRILDLHEAWNGRPDPAADPASTVLAKYENQAPFYASARGQELDPRLLARIQRRVGAGGQILVLGSGSGRECFVLAESGFKVRGVDFSPAMVLVAEEEAKRRGLEIEFQHEDLRSMQLSQRSVDAVLFTYDVYSFLPEAAARLAMLRNLRRSLRPDGVVYLSARRLKSSYQRLMLTLQLIAQPPRDPVAWGRSHTRWIAMDGRLHRSFVQVFTDAALTREIHAAGFTPGAWQGGHAALTPRS